MRRPIVIATALGIAGVALGRSRPHAAQRIGKLTHVDRVVEIGQRTVRRQADCLGFRAYLAAVSRSPQDRELALDAYRAAYGQNAGQEAITSHAEAQRPVASPSPCPSPKEAEARRAAETASL